MSGLPFAFLNPLALLGFLTLPILWLILRFLPPRPQKIFLPTTRFLLGLKSPEVTPQTAPWWLVLMRLSILALLILAFAQPVLHPQKIIPTSAPLRIVFDNGWSSTQTWTKQIAKAEEILDAASKTNRPVQIYFTAAPSNASGFLRADQALALLHSAEPMPWPNIYKNMIDDSGTETAWISSGLSDAGFSKTLEIFSKSALTIYLPEINQAAGLLRGKSDAANSILKVELPAGSGEKSITIQAFDAKGKLVNQISKTVDGVPDGEDIIDDSGLFAHETVYQWKAPALTGAGSVYLDTLSQSTGHIGIVAVEKPGAAYDYSDAVFYLSRAVEPFAKLETGSIENLISKNCNILILPDIADFSPDDLSLLEKFLKGGGILLRFGGKAMSEADNVLVPVPLKTGLRSLSGDMTWEKPLKLAAFPNSSPFSGEQIPDITVSRQLLAESSADLQNYIWAKLSDGTPFITAKQQGHGLIVLVHTTATPDWSDFVLSGFYVTFLKELVELSHVPDKTINQSQTYAPFLIFNGWGRLERPDANVKPISKSQLANEMPSPDHPPGIYGDASHKVAFNLGDRLPPLDIISNLPANIKTASLEVSQAEKKLTVLFILIAGLLFLADWIILLASSRFQLKKALLLPALLLCFIAPARADQDIGKAAQIHLACVKSSNDQLCQTALYKISAILKARTSAEMGDPVTVDIEKDDLSFYPLLYWPIDTQQTLSAQGKARLAAYLGKGGMILIDTLDGAYETGQIMPSPTVRHLREMLQGIDIPLLKPAPRDHVLFKSFYLLNIRPEYDLTGKIWVQENSIAPEEGLSSVMITGEDWLHRWTYPQNSQDEEMAYRFGLNLVLYALTGTYKADQIHMKAILERMGQ